MTINLIFQILLILCVFSSFIHSKCVMKQDCDPNDPNCKPTPADMTEPHILTGANVVCPDYLGKLACCNDGQNVLLQRNFNSLDPIFGSKFGGCDICAINLKRFWCKFTCDPEQHTFMTVPGTQHFVIDGEDYDLLMVNMSLNNQMNCDLFNSCKKTKYASQVAAMSNAMGFTTFQGTEAYIRSPIFISMSYVKEGGLKLDIDPCDTVPDKDGKVKGFPVSETCKCNSCAKSCHFDDFVAEYPVLQGFSVLTVVIFYIIVILLTIIIYVCKCYYRKKNPDHSSRSSSIDSEFGHPHDFSSASQTLTNNTKNNINNLETTKKD